MSEKIDRRKVRTKKLLRKALIEVMERKGAERITVSDLTKEADINRGTFYLHYMDSMDMLKQVKEEIWEGLRQRMDKLDSHEYLQYAEKREPYPAMVKVVEYFGENADFFRVILGPKGDPSFAIRIKEFLKTQHLSKVLQIDLDISNTIIPYDYMVTSIASANLSILQHWIETGRQQPPSAIALMITHIVGNAAFQLLDT
ncbi:TetR/AcrR family transcriptional regulator [Paenibacillus monticola]|uniref:TetR family transcriptional regulator n=1 Tax=Paenibacillus monticola TaxID=2666075 RepID=A0A7X2H713_9BACL|nr:TetR/AcrR family transcriptional regulator [Paenibacillus monticola]MRN54716.1 TetR family transcriptional regulator [Paenibacillus monticola]